MAQCALSKQSKNCHKTCSLNVRNLTTCYKNLISHTTLYAITQYCLKFQVNAYKDQLMEYLTLVLPACCRQEIERIAGGSRFGDFNHYIKSTCNCICYICVLFSLIHKLQRKKRTFSFLLRCFKGCEMYIHILKLAGSLISSGTH